MRQQQEKVLNKAQIVISLVYPKMFHCYVRPQDATMSLQDVDDMIGIALFFRKVIMAEVKSLF